MTITAVIFDWAGTLVDHGSRAPVAALQDVFLSAGVPISVPEARLSMGIAKRDHIRAILALPRVATAWELQHRIAPHEDQVNALYADFIPKQLACLARNSGLIEGVLGTAEGLRMRRGIRIGSTTGYTRRMLDFLVERAREQGFVADCAICPEDVPGGGRPAPWMCYLNAVRLAVGPLWSMVKIGDTPSDIEEGLNAGMWTIGITRTGNEAGLTEAEWNSATIPERTEIIAQARKRLLDARAHYLVESVGDCLDTIDEIAGRLSSGERP
jgi:phosphonoacetaldehyde hydrolase